MVVGGIWGLEQLEPTERGTWPEPLIGNTYIPAACVQSRARLLHSLSSGCVHEVRTAGIRTARCEIEISTSGSVSAAKLSFLIHLLQLGTLMVMRYYCADIYPVQ